MVRSGTGPTLGVAEAQSEIGMGLTVSMPTCLRDYMFTWNHVWLIFVPE